MNTVSPSSGILDKVKSQVQKLLTLFSSTKLVLQMES